MKYKLISLLFILCCIDDSRASQARRKTPRVQLSVKSIRDDIGYIQPIHLGSNEKLYNITRILTLLKENAKKENHKLPTHGTEDERFPKESVAAEKGTEESDIKEYWFKKDTPKKKTETIVVVNRGTDSSDESDRSEDSDEEPMMRNGETNAGAELQYDLDEEILNIALKK